MNIKIAVAYHKPGIMLKHPLYIPVQVGSILHPDLNLGITKDSEGKNISAENGYYCELTATYWLWKNIKADAKGLFHYRRIFSPGESQKINLKSILWGSLGRNYTPRIKYNSDSFIDCSVKFAGRIHRYLTDFNILVSKPCYCQPNVYKYFSSIGEIYLKILDEAVKQINPLFHDGLKKTFRSKKLYYGNMIVMRSDEFDSYCEFLFSSLERVKSILLKDGYLKDLSGEKIFNRTLGYLAEILTSTYVSHRKEKGDLKIKELPVAILDI